jgi:hypothetical protein
VSCLRESRHNFCDPTLGEAAEITAVSAKSEPLTVTFLVFLVWRITDSPH